MAEINMPKEAKKAMFRNWLIVSFIFMFPVAAFPQIKSVYSDLNPANCETVSIDQGMPGNYVGKCKGVGGYDLEYYLDDERNSLGVVLPSKKVADLNFWSNFHGFSELGVKAEWRVNKDKPVALIVRLNVSDQEDQTKKTSYLVVTKISEDNACVIDVLKPGKDQNVKARQSADKASAKKCLPDFAELEDEFPADIANWSGQNGDKILAYPAIYNRLNTLLGEENYKSFLEYFESNNPIEKRGNLVFTSGCMYRACTHVESAIAIDLTTNAIHAAIFNEVEGTKYFNENGSKTPEPIIKWAKRLEDLKKDGRAEADIDKTASYKIDEITLINE